MHGQAEPLDQDDVELINSFAERYSLVWEIDIHGIKPLIVGKDGAFIYVYSDVPPLLGVAFCPDDLPNDGWNLTIKAALHCGMKILRDCQSESYLSFDGQDEKQCNLALTICGATPMQESAALRSTMLTTITAARQRKQRQIEHQRVLKELALIRAGADLSDYDPTFQPGEYRLTL